VAGNHAAKQFQLDAFGEALSLFAEAARQGQLDAEGWKAAEVAVEAIGRWWQEPDGGIWELENRNWTHSRLACVGGIRAICGAGAAASRIGPVDGTGRRRAGGDGEDGGPPHRPLAAGTRR
jgi:GH15 family glucan-1,4-alpha-glucosidase